MCATYLGIDIGGTAVKLGLVDATGSVLERMEQSVSYDRYKTPILDTVLKTAKEFTAGRRETLAGIGVSATGQIDSTRGVVAGTCGNLPGWKGTPIRERLQKEFGLPVSVANDANCMCLGEAWVGAAQGYTDVIGITIGTGLGGGIMTGGHLLEGVRGLGGELGHYRTHAVDGRPCTCGAKGCWEQYASTTALVRAARQVDDRLCDGRAVFKAVEAGDAKAQGLLACWIEEIAEGLAGLVHIFNPQVVLVGGGVSAQQELLIAPLERHLKARIMPAFADGLRVEAAALGNDAGLVGAVFYLLEQLCPGGPELPVKRNGRHR